MNAMRNLLLLVAAIGFGGFAACNTTVGECWYYGEGTEMVTSDAITSSTTGLCASIARRRV